MGNEDSRKNPVNEALALYGLCSLFSSADPIESLLRNAMDHLAAATNAAEVHVEITDDSGGVIHKAASGGGPIHSPMDFPIVSGTRRLGTLHISLPDGEFDPSLRP